MLLGVGVSALSSNYCVNEELPVLAETRLQGPEESVSGVTASSLSFKLLNGFG